MTQNSGFFNYSGYSGITRAGADKYPNPFFDIASEYVPSDINQIFALCEYLMTTMAPFRAVTSRVTRYFLTELVVDGEEGADRERYEEFLNGQLRLLERLGEIGDDYATYGNVFISMFLPFDRFLECPDCGTQYHCKAIDYKFKNMKFRGVCPKCGSEKEFGRVERRSPDIAKAKLIRWNPKHMKLRVHPVSDNVEYYMHLDEKLKRKITEGDPYYLNDTPWDMVEAALSEPDKLYKFKPGTLFHLKSGNLSGLPIKGWGVPPMLPNFKLAYYIQLLRRYDEAITLDYIVPFRVLFPQAAATGQDALSLMSMGTFVSNMQKMVESHRRNLTSVQVAPFPVGYQMLGGEAKQLSPKDSIQMAMDELFTSMGYPAELYRGTLSLQAAPVALRLFEKEWGHLVNGYESVIDWVVKTVGRYFMWSDNVKVHLRSVTLADDLDRKAMTMQAAAGMDISKQTAYRGFGIDFMDEQKRIISEQQEIQRMQQKAMDDQAVQQLDGGGGGTVGPGGVVGATPGDVWEQAGEIANQLLTQTPATLRRGQLVKIKHSNPTLHAMVIQRMDELRQQAAAQGVAQLEQGGMQ